MKESEEEGEDGATGFRGVLAERKEGKVKMRCETTEIGRGRNQKGGFPLICESV